jgi:hypothetical protein
LTYQKKKRAYLLLCALGAEVKKLHANLFTSRKTGVHEVGAECGSNTIHQHFYVLKHEGQQFSSVHLTWKIL